MCNLNTQLRDRCHVGLSIALTGDCIQSAALKKTIIKKKVIVRRIIRGDVADMKNLLDREFGK